MIFKVATRFLQQSSILHVAKRMHHPLKLNNNLKSLKYVESHLFNCSSAFPAMIFGKSSPMFSYTIVRKKGHYEEDSYYEPAFSEDDNLMNDVYASKQDSMSKKIHNSFTDYELMAVIEKNYHLLMPVHVIELLHKFANPELSRDPKLLNEVNETIVKLFKRLALQSKFLTYEEIIEAIGLAKCYGLDEDSSVIQILLQKTLLRIKKADLEDLIHLNFLIVKNGYCGETANEIDRILPSLVNKFIHTDKIHPELLQIYCCPLLELMLRGNDLIGFNILLNQILENVDDFPPLKLFDIILLLFHPNVTQLLKDSNEAAKYNELVMEILENLKIELYDDQLLILETIFARIKTASTVLKYHPAEKYTRLLENSIKNITSNKDYISISEMSKYLKIFSSMNYLPSELIKIALDVINENLLTSEGIHIDPQHFILALTKTSYTNVSQKELFHTLDLLMNEKLWNEFPIPFEVQLKILLNLLSVNFVPPEWFKRRILSEEHIRLYIENEKSRRNRRNILLLLHDIKTMNTVYNNIPEIYNIKQLLNESYSTMKNSLEYKSKSIIFDTLDFMYPNCVHSNVLFNDFVIDNFLVLKNINEAVEDGLVYLNNDNDADSEMDDSFPQQGNSFQKYAIIDMKWLDVIYPASRASSVLQTKVKYLQMEGFNTICLSSNNIKHLSSINKINYLRSLLHDTNLKIK